MKTLLINTLLGLAPRERLLIGVLMLIVVPIAVIGLVLLPLQTRHAEALINRSEAAALHLWVQDRVVELGAFERAPDAGPQDAIGLSGIEESLTRVRLRGQVTELSSDSDGGVALRFDSVKFTALATWLSSVDPAWGYTIAQFRLSETDRSGMVSASLQLTPQSR